MKWGARYSSSPFWDSDDGNGVRGRVWKGVNGLEGAKDCESQEPKSAAERLHSRLRQAQPGERMSP